MKRAIIAILASMVTLAGCGLPASPGPPSASASEDFVRVRRQAGIADCPTTDAAVPSRPDGLPDLVVECLGGGSGARLSGLRGRPMLINFWAQWCEPCRAESGFLRRFAAGVEGKMLVLGVNFADPRPELAIEFAQLVGWHYPQFADEERRLEAPLRLPGIPVTLLVDPDGRIVARHAGPFKSSEELAALVSLRLGVTP